MKSLFSERRRAASFVLSKAAVAGSPEPQARLFAALYARNLDRAILNLVRPIERENA